MIVFPNAKINLGLQITDRLLTGYHSINTCLYPIPWCDILEVVSANKNSFQATGIEIPKNGKDDIVVQAYKLLRKDYTLPELSIHLHKLIPIGAGLGGGSADAAFMLKYLSNEFQLFLEDDLLEDYASTLGSDCPFFIRNKPALATGTGTDLEPINVDLSGKHLVLVSPSIHASTKQAYARVTPKQPTEDIKEVLMSHDLELWKTHLVNDFEESLFGQIPELKSIKEKLYDMGAAYAAMSGSGSTMFAIFEQTPTGTQDLFPQHTVKEFIL